MSESAPLIDVKKYPNVQRNVNFRIFLLVVVPIIIFAVGMSIIFVLTPQKSLCATTSININTTEGVVQGMCSEANGARKFLGIPYASAPTGNLRFRPSIQPQKRNATLQAFGYALPCIQVPTPPFPTTNVSEDCLFLNIFTPPPSNTLKSFPVIFYIHGGGYTIGSGSSWDGGYLSQSTNHVVVTFSYRLGALGFLAHPSLSSENQDFSSDASVSGNYGITDAIQALNWVNQNIANFGGNPKEIKVFGLSAGGAIAQFLLLSEFATEKFAEITIFSSGSLSMKTLQQKEQEGIQIVENQLNCSGNATEISSCLRLLPSSTFAFGNNWGPCVDGYFLMDQPEELFSTKSFKNLSIMIGSTQGELDWYNALLTPSLVNTSKEDVLSQIDTEFGANSTQVLDIYKFENFTNPFALQAAIHADLFNCRVKRILNLLSNNNNNDNTSLYLLRFDHLISTLPKDILVAPHGTDAPFMFNGRFCWPYKCEHNEKLTTEEDSLGQNYRKYLFSLGNASLWEKYSEEEGRGLRVGPGNVFRLQNFADTDNCAQLWYNLL